MQDVIVMQNISKTYATGGGRVQALDGVDLRVPKGAFLGITGSSGSGKSTLMNVIGCLDTPTSGKYWFCGQEVSRLNDKALSVIRNRQIGFVFQSFCLLEGFTALENVELPLLYGGVRPKQRRQMAIEALQAVGLEERMHHRPGQLSGGQQQRVAIARALAGQPPVILADEPTGNLDSASGAQVLELLYRLHDGGKTIIMITHDQALADSLPRQVIIADGKIKKCLQSGE